MTKFYFFRVLIVCCTVLLFSWTLNIEFFGYFPLNISHSDLRLQKSFNSAGKVHFITVHMGKTLSPPMYLYDSLHSIRRYNRYHSLVVVSDLFIDEMAAGECVHYIYTHEDFLTWRNNHSQKCLITNILTSSVPTSANHFTYSQKLGFVDDGKGNPSTFRDGFVEKATLRLFLLYDVLVAGNIENSIHFEYDNLIFFQYEEFSDPLLKKNINLTTNQLGTNYDLANLMWIRNAHSLDHMLSFFCSIPFRNEMELLRAYRAAFPNFLAYLPIYWSDTSKSLDSTNLFGDFQALFDSAALGQWAGGVDPRNMGGVEQLCCFENSVSPYNFSTGQHSIVWKEAYPWVGVQPFLQEIVQSNQSKLVRIMNLHVHSKELKRFLYRRPGSDFVRYSGDYVLRGDPSIITKIGRRLEVSLSIPASVL